MTTLALLLCGLLPPPAAHDTTFWDSHWQHVSRANAVYYGWTAPLDSGRCSIRTFYFTGERQMEAIGYPGPPVVKDGLAMYYYRSGAKSSVGQFANGKREGIWSYWQPDGTLRRQVQWHAGIGLPNANEEARLTADNKVPQLVEQMPKFLGPLPLAQYLGATMHRPASMPAGGGKVYVQFIVGPQGNITSTRIVKGFDPACDAEALRAVTALPRWQPGLQNGQPAAVRFIVPITFR